MTYLEEHYFEWQVHDSALVNHLQRCLSAGRASYTTLLKGDTYLIKGEATASTLADCEQLQEEWYIHKPETILYHYTRKDVPVFQKALRNLFPNKVVNKPFPGTKGTLRLFGARSEHKKLQERLLEEEVNHIFSSKGINNILD